MLSTISLGVILLLGFLVVFVDVRRPNSWEPNLVGWAFIALFVSSVAVKGVLDHNQAQSAKGVERQLQATIDSLTNDVDELNTELNSLSQKEAIRAQSNDEGFNTLQRENEGLRAQVSSLESSNALLNARVEDLTKLNDAISAQLTGVSATNDQLLERNNEQSAQLSIVQSDLTEARSEMNRYATAQDEAIKMDVAERERRRIERRTEAELNRLCSEFQLRQPNGKCSIDLQNCEIRMTDVSGSRRVSSTRRVPCD